LVPLGKTYRPAWEPFFDDQTYALAARVESLRAQGHIVIVVGSPQAALDSLLTNPIEAAVLDCHMASALLVADLPGTAHHHVGVLLRCALPPTTRRHRLHREG
jgi:hypothetical protein